MKPFRSLLADARRHRGLALIIVLSMLALATIVILAFLSIADTEHKATITYSSAQTSRRLADTAVNLVVSQIRAGSQRDTNNQPVIHATQPGAVRKYNAGGIFIGGYKLFSDKDMVFRAPVAGADNPNQYEEQFVSQSEPPNNWNTGNNIARYVDINEPVVKGVLDAAGNATQTQIYFPVMDPRAAQDIDQNTSDNVPVEGFFYAESTALNNNNLAQASEVNPQQRPIVLPGAAGGSIDDLRLAMPVQWLYLLKDGAIGYLNDSLQFNVLNGSASGLGVGTSSSPQDVYGVPSETNPIVGRIAFWTDDESCKININTASEPTYSGQPLYYHGRDQSWADFPPARGEYQRFPGHPATVALSSVLYPNPLQTGDRSLDTYGPSGRITGAALSNALAVKERLYDLIPRIHTGGSLAGTRTFEQDKLLTADTTEATPIALQQAAGERLYASVDELLFAQTVSGNRRVLNNANAGNVQLFNRDSLERSSAFLTAHSRASEINLYGLPRIAMWPIASNSGLRTGFDNLIEFCSRVGTAGNNYIFQRANARTIPGSANASESDVRIPRNLLLLGMLDKLLSRPFPTATIAPGEQPKSFAEKHGEKNADQLVIQFFDYIRCTNLYDSFHVPQNRSQWPTYVTNGNNANNSNDNSVKWPETYQRRDEVFNQKKTFTDGVARNPNSTRDTGRTQSRTNDPAYDRFLPGHGQVAPARWTGGSAGTVQGFGRFVTISEIGLHFICTGDGQPDMYSWRIPRSDPNPEAEDNEYVIPPFDPNSSDVSGGRTALEIDEGVSNAHVIRSAELSEIRLGEYKLTNLAAENWAGSRGGGTIKARYYSNYPPLTNPNVPGFYGTDASGDPMRSTSNHPGYDPRNWNYTLKPNTPLTPNQKRLQAMLHLEFFCPMVGYTQIIPNFTVVVRNLNNIEINGRAYFSVGDAVIKSAQPIFEPDSTPEVGGFASFRKIALGRRGKQFSGSEFNMPADTGYDLNAGGSSYGSILNLDLISDFFTVERDQRLDFSSGAPVLIEIYDSHDYQGLDPIQTIQFTLSQGQAPTPDLITAGSYRVEYDRADGSKYIHPPLQAPRWWVFNRDGALGRFDELGNVIIPRASLMGRLNRDHGQVDSETRAVNSGPNAGTDTYANTQLQSVPGARALIYARDSGNYRGVRVVPADAVDFNPTVKTSYGPGGFYTNDPLASWDRPWHFGSDVVRTLQPAHGDPRLIAAKPVVNASEWTPHRLYNDANAYIAHNFSSYAAGNEPGFDYGGVNETDSAPDRTRRVLPSAVVADAARTPDAPHNNLANRLAQRYYDFDDSDPGGRVGPFINKPDEGNLSVGEYWRSGWSTAQKWRGTYFRSDSFEERYANGRGSYFTPNRLISSPVMFGSLPSRLHDSNGQGAWTNLLFRPHVIMPDGDTGGAAMESSHPGELTPPDHYLLDLFWMPVVEPYAISEPMSTAGKINMNYQMLPFTHIRRATAMHALMKGEMFAALPNDQYNNSKTVRNGWGANGSTVPVMRNETNANAYWHRTIAIDRFKPLGGSDQRWWEIPVGQRVQGTLRQFEERFNFGRGPNASDLPPGMRGGLFRSASQICEIHLLPNPVPGTATNVAIAQVNDVNNRAGAMGAFWAAHCSTGDNTRERPYSNLYARLTTRSNTFRVHVRAQSIRKSLRSVSPNEFDPNRDLMTGEFRGSFLLERYIDQGDLVRAGNQVDFAAAADPFTLPPLENYYRFRILESKRFAP